MGATLPQWSPSRPSRWELPVQCIRHQRIACVTTSNQQVLLLSKYDFYHCVDARTQDMMQAYAKKFYFDESSIRRSIQRQHQWEAYKKLLLKDVYRGVL